LSTEPIFKKISKHAKIFRIFRTSSVALEPQGFQVRKGHSAPFRIFRKTQKTAHQPNAEDAEDMRKGIFRSNFV
jgi:hypothetical protein